ncbi:hypothetical protein [Tenacibaculum agarivorans]|uniref:hypothetical protein n=1 Tax=Tenacibaculum agarivorans TaxID=1908389 RepID=UPI000B0581B9|nr:hypothetical protein [Tenacibaculum agarivorans]
MRIGKFLVNISIFVFIVSTFNLFAQPDFNSKQILEGVAIFRDNADPLLFYYEPSKLILNTTKDGHPDFKFLDMRYTGSKCYGDEGEKQFMSLIQFGVILQKIDPKIKKRIQSKLKKYGRIKLKPLPISHIDTRLILPVESNTNSKNVILDDDGSLEANDKSGYSSSKSYWTKRIFTVRLNKHESQLLNTQLKDKLLGINLNYTYHSNVWMPNKEQVLGSKEFRDQFEKEENEEDENKNIQNRIIGSNTLTIHIDTNKYPDIIKQIDLNEEIPPTYAAIEIKCHDFLENLRPELYMKIVEIEAVSVDNEKPIKIKTTFRKKYTDLYTQHINFPYAVDMNMTMRYRITEIDTNGERSVLDWMEKPECESIIDVTSTREEQTIVNTIIDIELNHEIFEDESVSKIEFKLLYTLQNQKKTETLTFLKDDDISLQSIRYNIDKNTKVFFTLTKYDLEKNTIPSDKKLLTEKYLYINDM